MIPLPFASAKKNYMLIGAGVALIAPLALSGGTGALLVAKTSSVVLSMFSAMAAPLAVEAELSLSTYVLWAITGASAGLLLEYIRHLDGVEQFSYGIFATAILAGLLLTTTVSISSGLTVGMFIFAMGYQIRESLISTGHFSFKAEEPRASLDDVIGRDELIRDIAKCINPIAPTYEVWEAWLESAVGDSDTWGARITDTILSGDRRAISLLKDELSHCLHVRDLKKIFALAKSSQSKERVSCAFLELGKKSLTEVKARKWALIIPKVRKILLAGPSGTGKTTLAKAFAHQLGRQVIIIHSAELHTADPMHAPLRITNLFTKAIKQRAVLLFEEFDGVASSRAGNIRDQRTDEISTLMKAFEALDGASVPLAIFFTTNYPEKLDQAIVENPKRVNRTFRVDLPDQPARREILDHYLRRYNMEEAATWINLERMEGWNGGAIEVFVKRLYETPECNEAKAQCIQEEIYQGINKRREQESRASQVAEAVFGQELESGTTKKERAKALMRHMLNLFGLTGADLGRAGLEAAIPSIT